MSSESFSGRLRFAERLWGEWLGEYDEHSRSKLEGYTLTRVAFFAGAMMAHSRLTGKF